jgi:hypothetical protein
MRRWLAMAWVVPALWLVTPGGSFGMGMTGGRDVINPAIDFKATLTDKDGVKVGCDRLNIGGDVQLEGDMGRGSLRIAFENIRRIDFGGDSRDYRTATVQLKNGRSVSLKIRNSLTFYGQTAVGLYQIRARDLQSIDFSS